MLGGKVANGVGVGVGVGGRDVGVWAEVGVADAVSVGLADEVIVGPGDCVIVAVWVAGD
jgi:hypothetical protein